MKKTLKTIQKEDSKIRILNVASRLFKRQGYRATGIDQLMAEAGLTAGAFYAHFKSKEDLLEQSLQHALLFSKSLLVKDGESLTGRAKTEFFLKKYCSVGHRDFPDRGCVLPALASEIYHGTQRTNHLIANYIDKWSQMIAESIDEELSVSEKKELALQIISRSVGAVLLSRIVKETDLSEQILSAAQKF